jgi:hypothetical protein
LTIRELSRFPPPSSTPYVRALPGFIHGMREGFIHGQ